MNYFSLHAVRIIVVTNPSGYLDSYERLSATSSNPLVILDLWQVLMLDLTRSNIIPAELWYIVLLLP